jgi:hypothetical protein
MNFYFNTSMDYTCWKIFHLIVLSPFGLELAMVIFRNSNDEIIPNINWEFRLKSGGLNCVRIYIHLIILAPSIIWWNVKDIFFKKTLLQYLKKVKTCSNYI